MRSFEFARKFVDGKVVEGSVAYESAQIPMYMERTAAGADFFAAEETVIPSIWSSVARLFIQDTVGKLKNWMDSFNHSSGEPEATVDIKPTLVHTGIKAQMESDEVLYLYNRSSNPKRGLILANGVGVIDSEYYNNESNDGEILFAFYNIKPWSVKIVVGDRIGQGVFAKFLRPEVNLRVNDVKRGGGIGSTGR